MAQESLDRGHIDHRYEPVVDDSATRSLQVPIVGELCCLLGVKTAKVGFSRFTQVWRAAMTKYIPMVARYIPIF